MRTDSAQSTDLPQTAIDAIWKGNTIEAIKIVRLEQNIGLKEAKDQVDTYVRSQPALQHKLRAAQAQATQTLIRWLVGALMLAAVAIYIFVSGR